MLCIVEHQDRERPVSAMRLYALAAAADQASPRESAFALLRVQDRIEHLEAELGRLQDRADTLVTQIEEDDAGGLCLLTVADCAALHLATGDLVAAACEAARLAGYTDEQLGDVLGLHRTTVARRYSR